MGNYWLDLDKFKAGDVVRHKTGWYCVGDSDYRPRPLMTVREINSKGQVDCDLFHVNPDGTRAAIHIQFTPGCLDIVLGG